MQSDVSIFTSTWETVSKNKTLKLINNAKKKKRITVWSNESDNVIPLSIRVECQSINRSKMTFHTTNFLLQNLHYCYYQTHSYTYMFLIAILKYENILLIYYNTNLVIKFSLELSSTMISGCNSWCILTTSKHNLWESRKKKHSWQCWFFNNRL